MWQRFARGALAACGLWLSAGALAQAGEVLSAEFAAPTSEYPHAVLGDELEWKSLVIRGLASGDEVQTFHIPAGENQVFEDLAPRLWDVTGDGLPEVVVVQSHQSRGARLVIFGLLAGEPVIFGSTPYIGTRFRWLAPVGAADLDGDGHVEIGFVDRPHLAKTLRLWRYSDGRFAPAATLRGVSNHRIGEDFISGGLRACDGAAASFILADAAWRRVLSVSFDGEDLTAKDVGRFSGPASIEAALAC